MVKCCILVFSFACLFSIQSICQTSDSTSKSWNFSATANLYFIPSDFFVLPIVTADYKRLHLESRYNYEDRNTISLFGGYTFQGGKKFTYSLVPMVGGIAGRSNGIAPGMEATFGFRRFTFYSESEYLFEFSSKENHYFYTWTELGFEIFKPFSMGMVIQKTKAYQSDFVVQRGAWAAYAFNNFTLKGYVFNPFSSDAFGILTLQYEF